MYSPNEYNLVRFRSDVSNARQKHQNEKQPAVETSTSALVSL
jgi:hypothetical protein